MKRIFSKILVVALILCMLFTIQVPASAQEPYDSYTYWSDVQSGDIEVLNRAMYEPTAVVDASKIGVASFTAIKGIVTDKQDNIYILDSTSRIVVTDKNFNLIKEIGLVNGTETYNDASSIYVYLDGTIYICDTKGGRILHVDADGNLLDTIGLPESTLIPDDFRYLPTKIEVNANGYLYVLCEGSYYGMLLYSPEKEFLGFFGSNTVKASIGSVLSIVMSRVFPNNVKKSNTNRVLPFSMVDICLDERGFIYTCNGFTKNWDTKGQIRKLSPGTGANVFSNTEANFVDVDVNSKFLKGILIKQNLMDVEVDSKGYVYALESAYGKIFMYDEECRKLTVFGGGKGIGTQVGTFESVSGLELLDDGNRIIVSDSLNNRITIFSITEFGTKAKEAITCTLEGDYDGLEAKWQEVLKLDSNFQPAYSGLARISLNDGKYEQAMEYSKMGYDRDIYGVAFEFVRTDLLDKYFGLVFLALVLVIGVLIAWLIISTKKKVQLVKNPQLKLMFATMIHPGDTFTTIKEKKQGSVGLCLVTLVIFYVTTVLKTIASGFLFSDYNAETFNSFWELVRSVGLVILWVVANWMICTLMQGKGKVKEILVVTCYSLWPLILEKVVYIVFSNVLLPSEGSFLGIFNTIAIAYFALLMIMGLLKIHDFSFGRFIGTTALSVLAMAAIVFLGIMMIILIQQLYGFVVTIATEILTL